MKNVVVTGGAGYIGSHTVAELLSNKDYNVTIIDNFSNSNPNIINNLYKIVNSPIRIYHKDCRDDIKDIMYNYEIDSIIHFAAFKSVDESVVNPLMYYDNNINSLINILDNASKLKINKIIFSSSCSLYGDLKQLPANENSPISDPKSPYAYTKLVCERILQDFSKSNPNVKIISLRYFNPVGSHESGLIGDNISGNNIMSTICRYASSGEEMSVFGNDYPTRDGTCIRDYIHVSDIANAHVLALDHLYKDESINYDVFNLGSNNGLSVLEIIESFERVNKIKVNYNISERREGDVIQIYSDSSKAEKTLGWKPIRTVDDMVSSAWNWYNNENRYV